MQSDNGGDQPSNPRDDTCTYIYKCCSNPRSTKKNGALHLLCEYHRRRANSVQVSYMLKKKLLDAVEPTPFDRNCDHADEACLGEDEWQDVYEALFGRDSTRR
ncbi:Aste57867_23520 [Aphanomyces stellatus]|uniref:Aste57867_23520 protein n=1 Tax=Aphanomyces stellatus TaxID=120398 RepID=A0A485LMX0_9STRA|nr:hypothetical protein As57867_023449 [Aphanomyces stellatus]VFU00165.1 Aste57867_23520 [Aphanomyces stellatus]